MKVLLDTNVILDVLLAREPHFESSANVWRRVENGSIQGFIPAHAVKTIAYLLERQQNKAVARKALGILLSVFKVAPIDFETLSSALSSGGPDFEDSVTAAAAKTSRCDLIVTRDPKGFRHCGVPSIFPEALLHLIITGPASRPSEQ